jgi:hypothetical protein
MSEKDPDEIALLISRYAENFEVSLEAACERFVEVFGQDMKPFATGVNPRFHAHIVVTGRNPLASPMRFAV